MPVLSQAQPEGSFHQDHQQESHTGQLELAQAYWSPLGFVSRGVPAPWVARTWCDSCWALCSTILLSIAWLLVLV